MPEIAEVARIVHFLRQHVVGRTIKKAVAPDDVNIFGKVGTSGPEFEKAVKGRKIIGAGSQGKYFWVILDKPPHVLMHFGMTGWLHIKGHRTMYTNYYNRMKPEEREMWPPKFWKFHLQTDDPAIEVAFSDPRRFGRIRLIDCAGPDIRKVPPLSENGPDPVVDPDVFTYDYLHGKMRSRHVPIKALLLDQAMISGIGNWVGDEVLFHARLHPEQYSDEFEDKEIKKLYESIRYVCQTAVDKLGDSDEFPEDWLFKYRWEKGGKGSASALPSGVKLAFVTVGGRTSCYAPSLQKKTGRIAAGAKEEPIVPASKEKKALGKAVPATQQQDEKPRKKRTRSDSNEISGNKKPAVTRGKVEIKSETDGTENGGRRSGRVRRSKTG